MQTKIFVSSTCYDLGELRDRLRESISEWGHIPLLSEFHTFPVKPDATTVETCCQNVEENADIFVLIIGSRRGSEDPLSSKPVTNLEYQTAVESGIPVYVFVQQDVFRAMTLWKKNPQGDFSEVVDDLRVFDFVEKVQSPNQWIYQFDKGSEILQTLKYQLSVYLRDLLQDRRRYGRGSSDEFRHESEVVRSIVSGRPFGWEGLLASELLRDRSQPLFDRLALMRNGEMFVPVESVSHDFYLNWVQGRFTNLGKLIDTLEQHALPKLTGVLSSKGKARAPIRVKNAVEYFVELMEYSLRWEFEHRSIEAPEHFESVHELMANWGGDLVVDLKKFVEDFRSEIKRVSDDSVGGKEVRFMFELSEPSGADRFSAELNRAHMLAKESGYYS